MRFLRVARSCPHDCCQRCVGSICWSRHQCRCNISHAGWSKFYPKGKGRRPETPKGAKDDKAAAEPKNLSEAFGKNGIGQAFLFAAAMTLAFSLVSMGRSDAQAICSLPSFMTF